MEFVTILAELANIVALPVMIYQALLARAALRAARAPTSASTQFPPDSRSQATEGVELGLQTENYEQPKSVQEALDDYKMVRRKIRWGDNLSDYEFIRDYHAAKRWAFSLVIFAFGSLLSALSQRTISSLLLLPSLLLALVGFGLFQWAYARLRRRFPTPPRPSRSDHHAL